MTSGPPMKLVVLAAVLAVGGCSKKAAPPPPPFTGTLTIERIMGAKDLVNVFDPWDAAFAKLQGQLGAPQQTDDDSMKWAAMEGDVCAYMEVNFGPGDEYKKKGIIVDGVQEPMKVEKSGPIGNRADCLEIAGKAGTPEDPNAAPPPADGSPVSDAVFKANAYAGRSKWVGKRVKVAGDIKGIGGIAVTIGDGVSCTVKTALDPALLGKPAIAEGTVKVQTTVTGGGEVSQHAELDDCVVTVN